MDKSILEEYYYKYYIDENYSIEKLGKLLGYSRSGMGRILRKNGLLTRADDGFEHIKKDFNIYAFDNWSEEMSYWLGFIAADGSIHKDSNTLSIQLKHIDKGHLDKFSKFIKYKGNVAEYNGNNGDIDYTLCRIHLASKYMKSRLMELGIFPNKSNMDYDMLDYVPDKYRINFIIGYFDGDGSVYFQKGKRIDYNISIVGNKSTINSIYNYLYKYIGKGSLYEKGKNLNVCSWSRKDSLIKFFSIYKKSKVNLDRKYDKFKDILEYIESVKTSRRKVTWPTKTELEKMIKEKSFESIGRKYGVNGNSVRKWCKNYKLPYRRSDINRIYNIKVNEIVKHKSDLTGIDYIRERAKKSSSGYKNVFYYKKNDSYLVRVKVDGKNKHFGSFDDPIEAAKKADEVLIEVYGEDAVTNKKMGLI